MSQIVKATMYSDFRNDSLEIYLFHRSVEEINGSKTI